MSKWKNISLFKFQRIDQLQHNGRDDSLELMLDMVCEVFGITEHELDQAGAEAAGRLIKKVGAIFDTEFVPAIPSRIGRYKMLYDVSSFTFGQYVELSYFFQGHIRNAHLALASASRMIFRKHTTEGHRQRADFFLRQPVEVTMGALKQLMENFQQFNNQYKSLFGLDKEAHDQSAPDDLFNKRYGWTYSAKVVAEYEGVPLDQAYALPIRQALNDLAYLKEKMSYEIRQHKQLMKNYKTQSNG